MYVAWLKDLRMADLAQVGGKNASLGEMIGGLAAAGVQVPGGYATTARAFEQFLSAGQLDQRIAERLKRLDPSDVTALAHCGAEIRGWIEQASFPGDVEKEIRSYYHELVKDTSSELSFAVRSSATAEDLPDGFQDVVDAADVQKRFLLARERGLGQILGRGRRAHGK